jgi:hypothetical protein
MAAGPVVPLISEAEAGVRGRSPRGVPHRDTHRWAAFRAGIGAINLHRPGGIGTVDASTLGCPEKLSSGCGLPQRHIEAGTDGAGVALQGSQPWICRAGFEVGDGGLGGTHGAGDIGLRQSGFLAEAHAAGEQLGASLSVLVGCDEGRVVALLHDEGIEGIVFGGHASHLRSRSAVPVTRHRVSIGFDRYKRLMLRGSASRGGGARRATARPSAASGPSSGTRAGPAESNLVVCAFPGVETR